MKPLTAAQVGALKGRLATAPEDSALRELAHQLGTTFQAFIYLFEAEQLNGINPLLSKNGRVRIFDQCRDLLGMEKAEALRSAVKMPRAEAEREGRRALGWNPLTLILA